eukprot:6720577-Alexandrium_andersonii.AAC.1
MRLMILAAVFANLLELRFPPEKRNQDRGGKMREERVWFKAVTVHVTETYSSTCTSRLHRRTDSTDAWHPSKT